MKTLGITYRLNHLVLSTILAVAAGSVSCGAASTPPASQVGATRAPVAPSAHGQIKVLGEALGDVPLTQPQRSEIDRLAQDAEARHAAVAAARRDLETALADQIEAGRLDRAALAPKIDAIVVSAQATQPPDRAAFERLHAILDSDQRTAFANAFEARVHERMGEGGGPIKHMKEWAEELKLTDDQRSQIGAMLKGQVEAARAHGQGEHGPARGAKTSSAPSSRIASCSTRWRPASTCASASAR